MNYLILVNKNNPCDEDYNPGILIEISTRIPGSIEKDRKVLLEIETYCAWKKLKNNALLNGIDLEIDSGYRSYGYQKKLMDYYIQREGERALKTVALPGQSEHHTGLALDYSYFRSGKYISNVKEDDPEYKWVIENCSKYGFILRYPKEKEIITGYSYEPWHLRYIGAKSIAELIMITGITLEEYLQGMKL